MIRISVNLLISFKIIVHAFLSVSGMDQASSSNLHIVINNSLTIPRFKVIKVKVTRHWVKVRIKVKDSGIIRNLKFQILDLVQQSMMTQTALKALHTQKILGKVIEDLKVRK